MDELTFLKSFVKGAEIANKTESRSDAVFLIL